MSDFFLAFSVNFNDGSIFDVHSCIKIYTFRQNIVLFFHKMHYYDCAPIRPTNIYLTNSISLLSVQLYIHSTLWSGKNK